MELQTWVIITLAEWHPNDVTLKSIWRYSCYDDISLTSLVEAWQTVYAMLHQIFNDTTKWNSVNSILSDFLKQIIFIKAFDSEFKVKIALHTDSRLPLL